MVGTWSYVVEGEGKNRVGKLDWMYTQQQPERPFTVNIMNGVGWVGSPHPSSEPQSWAEPVSSGGSSNSRVHVIICMAEHRATGSRVSPTGETDESF